MGEAVPDFVVIGHVTRDLHADGSTSIGGTAAFAALAAQRLGVRVGIVTSAAPDLLADLDVALAGVAVVGVPSAASTTFENSYCGGRRIQYLRARADPIANDWVPAAWEMARTVLLGPLDQEVDPMIARRFPNAHIGAAPQGWLRRWDTAGRVWPAPWEQALTALRLLHVLVLSQEDLAWYGQVSVAAAPSADGAAATGGTLGQWRELVPILVLTMGAHGATVYHDRVAEHFPAFAAIERDPTGAGDVFAAAFLIKLVDSGDIAAAAMFANCMASFVVEQPGLAGVPDMARIAQRLRGRWP